MKNLYLLASLTVALSALGQPAPVQQLESTQRLREQQQLFKEKGNEPLAPELYSGENEDMGPQRMLTLKPRHRYFDAIADSQYFYTSNVRLAEDADSSTIWVNSVEAAFTPPDYKLIRYDVSTRIGVRAQWYNYGLDGTDSPFSIFDFHAQTAYAEQAFSPWDLWRFTFGLEATRLLDQPDYHEFYKELAPNWGVSRAFPIGNDRGFILAYKGYYRLTEQSGTGIFITPTGDRTDHAFTLAYNQAWPNGFSITPFYRFEYDHYTTENITGNDRNDYFNTLGLFVSYSFNNWASVRTFFDFEKRQTDNEVLSSDYDKFDLGLGVTLDVRF